MNPASTTSSTSQILQVSEQRTSRKSNLSALRRFTSFAATCMGCALLYMQVSLVAQTSEGMPAVQPNPVAGAGSVIVHPHFGGIIFGFDIDPAGTEGILSEAFQHP